MPRALRSRPEDDHLVLWLTAASEGSEALREAVNDFIDEKRDEIADLLMFGTPDDKIEEIVVIVKRHLRSSVMTAMVFSALGQLLDLGPVQPGALGPQGGGPHRPVADPEAARHLPVAPPQDPLLPQDFAGMSHGQSLGRHPLPLWEGGASDRPASLRGLHPPGAGCPTREVITMPDLGDHNADLGDHDRSIPVITMDRSGCSRSSETRMLGT